jgi:hypothetical protein
MGLDFFYFIVKVDHVLCITSTLKSIQIGIDTEGRVLNLTSKRGNFSFFLIIFHYYIIYLSLRSLMERKKVFDFNYIFIVGIYLLNSVKFNSKYDTIYFQSLMK